MKANILFKLVLAISVLLLTRCEKIDQGDGKYNVLDGALINITNSNADLKSVNFSGIRANYINVLKRDTTLPDTLLKFSLGARFSKSGIAPFDVPVNFSTDYSGYNDLVYRMVVLNKAVPVVKPPEGLIQFHNNTTFIRKGNYEIIKADEPFFTVNPALIPKGSLYYLPVRLTTSSGNYLANPEQEMLYFVLNGIDRLPWSIVGFDSEERTGEGSNSGRAIHAIDQNPNTVWHTDWTTNSPPPPHFIAIDMGGSPITFRGISITHRINSTTGAAVQTGNAKKVQIEISQDNSTWEAVQTFDNIALNPVKQELLFDKTVTARYLKITVVTAYGDTQHCFIAEVDIVK